MRIKRNEKTCAICGKKEQYLEILSYSTFAAPNLDLKPNDGLSNLASGIQMCPHCNYCNFDLSEHIQNRFANPNNDKLKLWNDYEEVQEIIRSDKNNDVKKCLIMAEQYKGNLQYKECFNMLICASWFEANVEESKKIKGKALDYYLQKILHSIRDELLQIADTLRQAEGFESAQNFIDAADCLNFENVRDAQYVEKVINFEKNLIKNKDSNEHSQEEVK